MRHAIVLAALFAIAAPAVARADLTLRSTAFSTDAGSAPRAHLVPPLALGGLRLDPGAGAGSGTEPVLALVLGIFPGFGLGHYIAGAAWQSWAVIDVLLLVGLIVVSAANVGALEALAWIATVVERVIEGLDAYHKAGGGRMAARGSPRERAVALGSPVPARDAVVDGGAARPAELVLARF